MRHDEAYADNRRYATSRRHLAETLVTLLAVLSYVSLLVFLSATAFWHR